MHLPVDKPSCQTIKLHNVMLKMVKVKSRPILATKKWLRFALRMFTTTKFPDKLSSGQVELLAVVITLFQWIHQHPEKCKLSRIKILWYFRHNNSIIITILFQHRWSTPIYSILRCLLLYVYMHAHMRYTRAHMHTHTHAQRERERERESSKLL